MTRVDSLSIGRLHTRYLGIDGGVAVALDDVLHDVVAGSLERAAHDLLDGGRRSPWAVCIASVDVDIELDLGRPRDTLASEWARGLVEAVVRAVESGDAVGDAVVVYRTEHDALRDLVVGVARGRYDRHWAWQQLAFVGGSTATPTGIDVANALAARPEHAAAVIASCRADAWRVIDPIGWILIAAAMARAVGEQPLAGSWDHTSSWNDAGGRTGPDVGRPYGESGHDATIDGKLPDRRDQPPDAALVDRIVAAIPASAWSAAEGGESAALALLATTMVAPHAARRRQVLDAVVARSRVGAASGPRADAPAPVPPRPPASTVPSSSRAGEPDDPDEPSIDGPVDPVYLSDIGGVWYLVRLIDELDVMVRLARHDAARAPDLLAAVVARVAGVSVEDPAVVLVAGTAGDDDRSLDDGTDGAADEMADADAEIVTTLAGALIDELTQRGGGRLAGRDLDQLWRRRAEMTVGVGTIEVVFDLDDVDLDVRVLGLDVDPGFVWWSGSVVRFHYV